MKILGEDYTKRETIFLFTLLIVLMGFFLSIYAKEVDIKEYKNAYKEMAYSLYLCNNGYTDEWNGTGTITMNSSQFLLK